jgi:predicted lysophospholipase L1 biosynthesis ABC-type transport system permease subunit
MNGAESDAQTKAILPKLQTLPGVQVASRVYRSTASTNTDAGNLTADMLGVDPATFGQVTLGTSWRADYASAPLGSLLHDLSAHARGAAAGSPTAPLYAIVSQTFADQMTLHVGDRFALQLNETAFGGTSFVVGAIVHEFPTLYPAESQAGFVVVAVDDYLSAITANLANIGAAVGPNEFWLKTSANASQHAALLKAVQQPGLDVNKVLGLREAQLVTESNPVGAGIRGLLVVGAITAALLAVLGSAIQALLAARQRQTQFAILRTLGTARGQLVGLLLSEQVVVYLFGVVGGTLLGLLLTTATLPFLQFSDTLVDPGRIGIPPYVLVFNPTGMVYFYATLLGAFVLALLVAGRYAATIGLGQALRLGED